MVKRSRLSKKQKVGVWKRLKGEVREMPYLYGGAVGVGAGLAGSAVFPPLGLVALPSGFVALMQLPLKLGESIRRDALAEKSSLRKMTKEQRYHYLMKTYGHGLSHHIKKRK